MLIFTPDTHDSQQTLDGGTLGQNYHLTLAQHTPVAASELSIVRTLDTNSVSGTGTAGADNTAQDLVTIVCAANTLTQVGDRIRIRAFWMGDTGGNVTGTIKLNTVTVSEATDGGGATFQELQAYLHYVDDTHANIIAYANGVVDTSISAANAAGFDWDADQNFIISQDAIVNNHIIVYFFAADVFPK